MHILTEKSYSFDIDCFCLDVSKILQSPEKSVILFKVILIFSCSLQKRTREKLVNVLSLCGQEVGLTKNPSVRHFIFIVQ